MSKVFYLLNIAVQLYILNELFHREFFANFHTIVNRVLTRR
jgi:hypothetical protein